MAKGIRRTIKKPKAPRAALVLVGQRRPPPTQEDEDFEFNTNWDHLQHRMKEKRQAFCHEYIKDFNGSQALLRMGYQSKTPWVRASEWLKEPYTQWYLGQLMVKLEDKAIVTRAEILLGLKKEAHHYGLDGSAAARISAWRTMAKILGLEITKVEGNISMAGGVMVLPMSGSPEEWEKAAAMAQDQLKQRVRE
jgi:hypothetical protein